MPGLRTSLALLGFHAANTGPPASCSSVASAPVLASTFSVKASCEPVTGAMATGREPASAPLPVIVSAPWPPSVLVPVPVPWLPSVGRAPASPPPPPPHAASDASAAVTSKPRRTPPAEPPEPNIPFPRIHGAGDTPPPQGQSAPWRGT
jgi:hypothetical protein